MLHLYCFEECYRTKQRGGMRCPICQEDDIQDQLLLGCGHSICEECFTGMRESGRTLNCPVCRVNINTNNIKRITVGSPIHSLKESYLNLNNQDNQTAVSTFENYVPLVPRRPRFNSQNGILRLSDAIHRSSPILMGEFNNVRELFMGNFTNGNRPLGPGILPNSLRKLHILNRRRYLINGDGIVPINTRINIE